MKIIKPSIYSEMVWEQKLQRAKRDGGSIEWIVMRNRLSNIDAKNKRFMTQVTGDLSRRIGFRVAPGFSERVIFREMFLQGLTVLDIMAAGGSASLSLSHVAARQEVRDLLKTLQIPLINERIAKVRLEESGEEKEAASQQPEVTPSVPATPAITTSVSTTAPVSVAPVLSANENVVPLVPVYDTPVVSAPVVSLPEKELEVAS